MAVSIHDVAKRLNLSITTISRALDGYEDVAEETRRLVILTAREMGYAPNQAARQLRRQRTDIIGYILPSGVSRFSDPFYSEFISGLGDEAALHKYELLISTAPAGTKAEENAYLRWIYGRKVDGIVLNRIRLHDWRVQMLSQAGFPFVTLERSLDPVSYASVVVDGRLWFRKVVDHLVSLGHQRIAYVGTSSELRIQSDRFAGYQDGLLAAGLSLEPELVIKSDLSASGGFQAAEKLLALPELPTAIACINDMTAIGVMHAAHQRGMKPGKDVAVSGFDGITGADHAHPPLTTVNQPLYQIARLLVEMLVKLIVGTPLEQDQVIVEPILEIRESTIGKTA